MNINKHADLIKQSRGNRGFSFLAQRVPESADAPYRIAPVDTPIQPDDAVLLVLGGSGDGTNIEGHNGLLKYVNNFIRSKPELNAARVCIAVCNYGTEYPEKFARELFTLNKKYAVIPKLFQLHKQMHESLPALDIYNSVILPKITDANGARIDTNIMLKNIRGITILAYCAGGHTAMYLEQIMRQQMPKIGYSKSEINAALGQMPIIGYAMQCPYRKSNMRFISFESVADIPQTMSAFRYFLARTHQDFGLLHFAHKNSDTFYCTQIAKTGIEGNPNILYAIPIEEALERNAREAHPDHNESKSDYFNEHTFIGFVVKNGFSICGTKLQNTFKDVLVNATKNSIENAKGKEFVALPEISKLVGNDELLNAADKKFRNMRNKFIPASLLFHQIDIQFDIQNMILYSR